MPLVSCPDCRRDVSPRAPSCPHCGAPIARGQAPLAEVHGAGTEGLFLKSMNLGCLLVLVLLGIGFVTFVLLLATSKPS